MLAYFLGYFPFFILYKERYKEILKTLIHPKQFKLWPLFVPPVVATSFAAFHKDHLIHLKSMSLVRLSALAPTYAILTSRAFISENTNINVAKSNEPVAS